MIGKALGLKKAWHGLKSSSQSLVDSLNIPDKSWAIGIGKGVTDAVGAAQAKIDASDFMTFFMVHDVKDVRAKYTDDIDMGKECKTMETAIKGLIDTATEKEDNLRTHLRVSQKKAAKAK